MMFTAEQKAECAEREVKQRRRLYPHWIDKGRMSAEFAAEQIAMMEEIAAEYRAQVPPPAQGSLI